jgi:cytosine deaminase
MELDSFMRAAIEEAELSLSEGGIPIGSALVRNGRLVARGHNKRVQESDPILHAEIDCLQSAGRLGSFRDTILYSTLMPCYLCAGAVVQFGIQKVVAGESQNFDGAPEFMRAHGVEVVDLDLVECKAMLRSFIEGNPNLWQEDIGEL